jgi:sugar phosphate isomerase/epimerase
MKLAFSTVACPEWTLEQVASFGASGEYDGVELRSFGHGSTRLACDPSMTASAKVRSMFEDAGVATACIATGCRFDEPIFPPVIGRALSDTDRSVREAKSALHMAAALDVPFVRVFAFEQRRAGGAGAERLIVERLSMLADAARNTGVKIVLENGGSFPGASDIARLITEVDHPLLGAAYSIAAASACAEDPIRGANLLADRLWMVKLKDAASGTPCPIGDGSFGCRALVEHLAAHRFAGWVVVEWDRLWMPDLAEPGAVLADAASRIRLWSAGAAPTSVRGAGVPRIGGRAVNRA